MTTQEKISVIQAYADGKKIQTRVCDEYGEWKDVENPSWNFGFSDYRVKPEWEKSTYRPYKDFAEFRAEWEKHGGWAIDNKGNNFLFDYFNIVHAKNYLMNFTWTDDETPCGIKVVD